MNHFYYFHLKMVISCKSVYVLELFIVYLFFCNNNKRWSKKIITTTRTSWLNRQKTPFINNPKEYKHLMQIFNGFWFIINKLYIIY